MRRKIELYIGDRLADLSDQALVLYNYTMEDLLKPTAVKNSYSKQVTLPATPANDAIFGYYYRLDRRTAGSLVTDTGMAFDATKKTPFTIYADTGEVLQSGYLRLDGITTKGGTAQGYKVSLFGGLGELFHILTSKENGDKVTLADLTYLAGHGDDELDFNITAENVAAAWARVIDQQGAYPSGEKQIWDIINFAPAYNGIPTGEFSPDRAIATVADMSPILPAVVADGDNDYYPYSDGTVVVSLADKRDEWAVKDLRSYLQRPVLSVEAMLYAIMGYAYSAGGKNFEISDDFLYQVRKMWMTLQMLPNIKLDVQQGGEVDHSFTYSLAQLNDAYGDAYPANVQITDPTPSEDVKCVMDFPLFVQIQNRTEPLTLYFRGREFDVQSGVTKAYVTFMFVQLVAFDGQTPIGGSPVQAIMPDFYNPSTVARYTPQQLAELDAVQFTPWYGNEFADSGINCPGLEEIPSNLGNFILPTAHLECEATGASRFQVFVKSYTISYLSAATAVYSLEHVGLVPWCYDIQGVNRGMSSVSLLSWDAPRASVTSESSPVVRSGALITKAALLTTEKTPADYLLGLAKMLGGVFVTDPATGDVTLMMRNEFYDTGEATIDLSERVDRSKEITITPLAFNARWYDFSQELVQSAFAAAYLKRFGMAFGVQRVDTGYDFDAGVNKLMDGIPYKSVPVLQDSGQYWNIITQQDKIIPSIFLDAGVTARYINRDDNSSYDASITQPWGSATITYYDPVFPGYDLSYAPKMDFRGENGETVDGADVLCFYQYWDFYREFKLTDDTAAMIARVGKPCWMLYTSGVSLQIPNFTTALRNGKIAYFGIPKEVNIPSYGEEWIDSLETFYQRYWQVYIRDRFNCDTRVLKCRVHLDGLQVGQGLMRRFFWYEGSLWALNKISNYSLTTWDPVECEFVQVQDKDNYTNGQTL